MTNGCHRDQIGGGTARGRDTTTKPKDKRESPKRATAKDKVPTRGTGTVTER